MLFRHTGHNPAIIFGQIQNSTFKRKYLDYFVGDYNFWESPPKITEVTETPDACCVQRPEEATVDTHVFRVSLHLLCYLVRDRTTPMVRFQSTHAVYFFFCSPVYLKEILQNITIIFS